MSKDTGFSITSAERYSLALFELSEENNLLSQIEDQSSSILNLIDQSEDFSNLIIAIPPILLGKPDHRQA